MILSVSLLEKFVEDCFCFFLFLVLGKGRVKGEIVKRCMKMFGLLFMRLIGVFLKMRSSSVRNLVWGKIEKVREERVFGVGMVNFVCV